MRIKFVFLWSFGSWGTFIFFFCASTQKNRLCFFLLCSSRSLSKSCISLHSCLCCTWTPPHHTTGACMENRSRCCSWRYLDHRETWAVHLCVFTQGLQLHLGVSTLQRPPQHLGVSTQQGPELHIDMSGNRSLFWFWTYLHYRYRGLCCTLMCLHRRGFFFCSSSSCVHLISAA